MKPVYILGTFLVYIIKLIQLHITYFYKSHIIENEGIESRFTLLWCINSLAGAAPGAEAGERDGGGGLSTTGGGPTWRGGSGSLPITDPDPDAKQKKSVNIYA